MLAPSVCLLLFASLRVSGGPVTKHEDCYADNKQPYLNFGSKTAYELIHPTNVIPETVPDCEPLQVWMFCRHGTRYPKASSIERIQKLPKFRDEILENHKAGKGGGELCTKDLDNLRDWKLSVSREDQMNLTEQGERDLQDLARRLKTKFPTLLSNPYSPALYEFRYTDTHRTRESAENFAEGLFNSSEGVQFPDPTESDLLLRPYKNCTRWKQEVQDTPVEEASLFKDGDLVKKLINNVTKRLGFRDALKYKKLEIMYDICRFEKAWNVSQLSPWCAVFSEDNLKVMEYYEDVHSYYDEGHGNEINVKLGCFPIKDFMERFSQLAGEEENGSQQPRGVFYFSHSTLLHMLQARLGVHNDSEPLLHSNYHKMQDRQYKLSKIGTFTTNIEAVFYKCSKGDAYRVKFYESELPLHIEGCDAGMCSWNYVKQLYSDVAEQCSQDFCEMGT